MNTMDDAVENFVNNLLSKEAAEKPSDDVKPEHLVMELPKWFDEDKFNRGRKFYDAYCFAFMGTMLMGLVAVLAVPSILRVLVSTRRSNSTFTAYRRYLSTVLHTVTWFEHELKPGTTSWRSLETVRARHLRASLAAKAKGAGIVSQQDIALTQFGFVGFGLLAPDKFGIYQHDDDDWESYTHFWRVIGYMIGLEDQYNICSGGAESTRLVCESLRARVFAPCLENAPEPFEHSARVMLDGMWSVNPTVNVDAAMWFCRHIAGVPGYVYAEEERRDLCRRLRRLQKGDDDEDVEVTQLLPAAGVPGLPARPARRLRRAQYRSLDAAPAYSRLSLKSKFKLFSTHLYLTLYSSRLGRWYFNTNFKFSVYLMRYFPYLAFIRWGFKASMVNIFEEDPKDDAQPKPNSEYYRDYSDMKWYQIVLDFFW